MLLSYGFLPIISLPSRVSKTRLSLLDNIYCNNISINDDPGIIYTDLSDHFPVFTTIKTIKPCNTRKMNTITAFNYNKIPDLQNHLQNDLRDITHVTDPNVACERIIHFYTIGIKKFSSTFVATRKNTSKKPWITPGILTSIVRKNELFLLKSKNPSHDNIGKYHRYRNILVDIISKSKKAYIQSKLATSDPKKTWNTIKELTAGIPESNKLPDVFQTDNGTVEGSKNVAESFNTYFSNVGKKLKNKINPSENDPLDYLPNFVGTPLHQFQRTDIDEVKRIVSNMRNVGSGHDQINTKIFKATLNSIIVEIVYFLNLCLNHSVFPTLLKQAVIKPIFKTGDKHVLSNYRPISLLPVIS